MKVIIDGLPINKTIRYGNQNYKLGDILEMDDNIAQYYKKLYWVSEFKDQIQDDQIYSILDYAEQEKDVEAGGVPIE